MPSGRHPTALRFSRTLLHLVPFGVAGGVIISLFALAAFALLNGSKEAATGSIVQNAVRTQFPSHLDAPVASGNPVPATTETDSSNVATAKLPPPSSVQDPPTSQEPLARNEAEPVLEPPSPDRDGTAAVVETAPASARGDQSAGEIRPPEITQLQQPTVQPAPPTDASSPPPDASQPATSKTKILITDQEREEMFQTFEMREKQLSADEKANGTSTGKPVAQDESNNSPLPRNTGLRDRMKRQCGPIKDPAWYHHCVATFSAHYR